jgi:SAM-dependent methyltransferase
MRKNTMQDQHKQWEQIYSEEPDLYGVEPSLPAQRAANLFKKENVNHILELGSGQGRDTLYFARLGFSVHALDYAEIGISSIAAKAKALGLSSQVRATLHDVRMPLPFEDNSFDASYSHMLFCMALTTAQLVRLSDEVRRVLNPGGYHFYTIRHTGDPHYGTGIHRGEDMYEVGGFAVHFFSKEKVTRLARGFEIMVIDEFEEGDLPRKLFQVILRKI